MRQVTSRIGFYTGVLVCNAMVWGMFTVLNMPRIDASALAAVGSIPTIKRTVSVATTGKPTRVVVPSVGIDVGVVEGTFDPASQEWTLSDQFAYYAAYSVPANDSNGTTLIYGHARPAMFEPLQGLVPGTEAEAEVYTDNGKVFIYRYSSVREVLPSDTSVFTDVGLPTLVLQTCSGPWDSYRALYSFDFKEVRPV